MLNSIEEIQALPDIDILKDLGVSLEGIIEEMIDDYETEYESRTGRQKTLYAGDRDRILITVMAGQLYQAQERAAYLFKRNFLKWMEDEDLENWGANFGYKIPDAQPAVVDLEFCVTDPLEFDADIPEGTRATAGDNVFFATSSKVVLKAGNSSVKVRAVCSDAGIGGNDYVPGQINIIADPVPYISGVTNVSTSSGGADRASGDDLIQNILQWMSTYSTAGPAGAYEYWIMAYSDEIIDVSAVGQGDDSATENVYILLGDGKLPNVTFLTQVKQYLDALGNFPDTDKVNLYAPETVEYDLEITYYISKSRRDNEAELRSMIEDAIESYISYQGSKIGRAVDTAALIEYIRAAGAERAEIVNPTYQKVTDSQVAVCRSKKVTYGGLEG
jgi:phage-related baseplate assembly protein